MVLCFSSKLDHKNVIKCSGGSFFLIFWRIYYPPITRRVPGTRVSNLRVYPYPSRTGDCNTRNRKFTTRSNTTSTWKSKWEKSKWSIFLISFRIFHSISSFTRWKSGIIFLIILFCSNTLLLFFIHALLRPRLEIFIDGMVRTRKICDHYFFMSFIFSIIYIYILGQKWTRIKNRQVSTNIGQEKEPVWLRNF